MVLAVMIAGATCGYAGVNNSGIYGGMRSAAGNLPSSPPDYECIKVFDKSGTTLVAKGTCSGSWATFRVDLPPGAYIVEVGGTWEMVNGKPHFRPFRRTVQVANGKWTELKQPAPPGPVP